MTAFLVDLAVHILGVALCAAVFFGWWWEVHGRRARQRDLDRQESERLRDWRRRGRPLG